MGLFSTKKIITVASTVYNMAGDVDGRPNFLKSTMFAAVMNRDSSKYLGERIVSDLLTGPGIMQRNFFNWAVRKDLPGLPTLSVSNMQDITPSVVDPFLPAVDPVPAGQVASTQSAYISDGNFFAFAEQWLLANNPTEIATAWTSDYDKAAHEITIQYFGGGTDTFAAGIYDADKSFLVANYTTTIPPDTVVITGPFIWIYEIGTGNATLDALRDELTVTSAAEFFPVLPIRLDNVSIYDPVYDDITGNGLYLSTDKAFQRMFGRQSFTALVDEVEVNPDIADVDYAYILNGISLNVIENSGRKYLYKFLANMIPYQNADATYVANFQAAPSGDPQSTTVKLKTDHVSLTDFDMRVSWVAIDEELFTGLGKVGAVKGELWLEKDGVFTWDSGNQSMEKTKIFWQTGDNNYQVITVWGLVHQNFIYGGKSVDITAHEALDDLEISGFIFPLHAPTLKSISLRDTTQMATANTHIIFNSYQVVQQKWYQTFLGQLLIMIFIIVVSVYISPASMGDMVGLLGTNAAVGAGLGLTGISAVIAGAVVNAFAAMMLTSFVAQGATAIFGEKLGALIGQLVTLAVTMGMSSGFSNLSISNMLTPSNLLTLSSALANGYAGYVNAVVGDIRTEMGENQEDFDAEMKEINELIANLGGTNDLSFDPMQLTDVDAGNGQGSYTPESLDQFIHRTTMVGSEIVDITLATVYDFPDLSLTLPKS